LAAIVYGDLKGAKKALVAALWCENLDGMTCALDRGSKEGIGCVRMQGFSVANGGPQRMQMVYGYVDRAPSKV
jgi:hypothetical protein